MNSIGFPAGRVLPYADLFPRVVLLGTTKSDGKGAPRGDLGGDIVLVGAMRSSLRPGSA